MEIILALVFVSVTLITLGLFYTLWQPMLDSITGYKRVMEYHDPLSAVVIAFGTLGDPDARLREDAKETGITSEAHTFLGLTESQYKKGIMRVAIVAGVGMAVLMALISSVNLPMLLGMGLLFGIVTWTLVNYIYNDQVAQRTAEQVRQFPFFLDLFLLTVQSNGSIEDAISSYSAIFGDNEIAGELLILREDLKSHSLVDSFDRLRARIDNEGLRNILGDLTQKLRTGTELQATLEQQAEDMRTLREELAAQAAERLNAKFQFPVVLCAVAVLLIFLAPAIVHMKEGGFL